MEAIGEQPEGHGDEQTPTTDRTPLDDLPSQRDGLVGYNVQAAVDTRIT